MPLVHDPADGSHVEIRRIIQNPVGLRHFYPNVGVRPAFEGGVVEIGPGVHGGGGHGMGETLRRRCVGEGTASPSRVLPDHRHAQLLGDVDEHVPAGIRVSGGQHAEVEVAPLVQITFVVDAVRVDVRTDVVDAFCPCVAVDVDVLLFHAGDRGQDVQRDIDDSSFVRREVDDEIPHVRVGGCRIDGTQEVPDVVVRIVAPFPVVPFPSVGGIEAVHGVDRRIPGDVVVPFAQHRRPGLSDVIPDLFYVDLFGQGQDRQLLLDDPVGPRHEDLRVQPGVNAEHGVAAVVDQAVEAGQSRAVVLDVRVQEQALDRAGPVAVHLQRRIQSDLRYQYGEIISADVAPEVIDLEAQLAVRVRYHIGRSGPRRVVYRQVGLLDHLIRELLEPALVKGFACVNHVEHAALAQQIRCRAHGHPYLLFPAHVQTV